MWKHFNISWNRRKKRKHVNIGKLFQLIVFFAAVFCMGTRIFFAEEKIIPLEMIVLSEQEVYTQNFHVKLKISFKEIAYYNDSLYVSYHLVDPETKDIIQFENPRIQVPKPSDEGLAEVETDVSLEDFKRDQNLMLQFDIVDEANAFWFSSEIENFQIPEVIYMDDTWQRIRSGINKEIMDAPVIFGINVMSACICIVIIIVIKNKRIM